MKTEEIRELVIDVMRSEMCGMIKCMQDLVKDFAAAAKDNREMYDKHLTSLEKARDRKQENVEALIKITQEQIRMYEQQREVNRERELSLRQELQSAKRMVNKYEDFAMRMAESPHGNTSVSVK